MAGAVAPNPVAGQDSLPPRVQLRVEPAPLTQGTVRWLIVQLPWDGVDVLGGTAAGEPIHFERSPTGEYRGLVGVPVTLSESLAVMLEVGDGDGTSTIDTVIAVVAANYPSETIRVAPAMAKPNPAAAARIQRENARSRQVSLASQNHPRLWQGPFRVPRDSRITSAFGAARVYNGEVRSRHLGTDFAGAVGAPVLAAGRGVIAMVADFYLAGKAVYIDHGQGLVTAYFHLSRADVTAGDTVAAGQRIGAVGQSGRVTGPHLHWVTRLGTIAVDPMSLLTLKKEEAARVSPDSSSGALRLRSGQAP